ncbi:allantoate amidohydrolase [Phytoactinopolyspora alkaliphila]|uniref:Allantoate amidohydrolase n=2 Tax=Phytoactinopolyspora alkaliphila TaxID=1783498 RepID=A0A6N9YH27_9ACTN|nr:allantoate amidohydrolase [Phytoactinopolyspora alkaliphila]
MWSELEPVGRHPRSGGYRRFAWADADLECRTWFVANAAERDLDVEADGNGNLWAWWGDPEAGNALVTGSHLDSVPDGGAFDGPLGVVSAFAALDVLRARGFTPSRPVAIVAFSDEEGARFGVACGGSRLMTGELDADRGRALTDAEGVTMAEAMAAAGHDPAGVGTDPERLSRLGQFVELHVEQGRVPLTTPDGARVWGLDGYGAPIGLASMIWPHGRWRFDFAGRADHAGTTALGDRDDPMIRYADAVLAARAAAERHTAVATFGKVSVHPNGVNAIPSLVQAWLDARGSDEERVRATVADVSGHTGSRTSPQPAVEESWTPAVRFDDALRDVVATALKPRFGAVPVLPTGAGHDAGILAAAGVPAAMLFVRNPTGVSHSPAESADRADCLSGVEALADVLEALG